MVSVATKIGMVTMFSTMTLGRELGSIISPPTAQEVGLGLVGLLTDLREEIDEIQVSRIKERLELKQLKLQMGMLESK